MNKLIKQIVASSNLSTQEAWWLLEAITKQPKERLLVFEYHLTASENKALVDAIHQIKNSSLPLAYFIGNVPFGDLTLNVKPPILIPRQETEEWVHLLIKKLKPHEHKIKTILDIGTGSGCIALSLAHAFPKAQVLATDLNPKALTLAKENGTRNKIKNIEFRQSDLFKNIENKRFDLIVSNPPYIAPVFKKTIDESVLNWEDHSALFAEEDGLQLIKKIINKLPDYLSQSNLPTKFVVECDPEQINAIIELCKKEKLNAQSHTDTFGNQRTVWAS